MIILTAEVEEELTIGHDDEELDDSTATTKEEEEGAGAR